MIIQTLVSLYDRLSEGGTKNLPTQGYAEQKISFALVLDDDGNLTQIKDLREYSGKKLAPKMLLLPSIERSGSGFYPQFIWDNTQYVLGAASNDEKNPEASEKKKARAVEAFNHFRRFHHECFNDSSSAAIKALLKFLDNWSPEKAVELENWSDIADSNLFFMLGERSFIHELPEIEDKWRLICAEREECEEGQCLLAGKIDKLARLHPMLKNVDGAQAKGAAIVSFNNDAFCSYGKEQSYNAPLSITGAFKYTAVLNYLLRRNANPQRLRIGDTTTVFWTERASPVETFFGQIIDPHDETIASEDLERINQFLLAARAGKKPLIPEFDDEVKFYILGLSPNNSRLAIRFWYACTVKKLMQRIGDHFNSLDMERSHDNDPLNPGIWHLLKETARETKDISPVLGGVLMRSILEGTAYPMPLYNGVLNRIRADQRITYLRAAILKAVLTRNYNKEVSMSLDPNRKDVAYLLGRLFAVLEKAQLDALGKVNATIKDRYWGAASSTPGTVFPQLLHLAQFHIAKAEYGNVSDRRIAEIMEHVDAFPHRLDLPQQGLFAIGYYQQKNDFYKKS